LETVPLKMPCRKFLSPASSLRYWKFMYVTSIAISCNTPYRQKRFRWKNRKVIFLFSEIFTFLSPSSAHNDNWRILLDIVWEWCRKLFDRQTQSKRGDRPNKVQKRLCYWTSRIQFRKKVKKDARCCRIRIAREFELKHNPFHETYSTMTALFSSQISWS
jgi:hypothetical protein